MTDTTSIETIIEQWLDNNRAEVIIADHGCDGTEESCAENCPAQVKVGNKAIAGTLAGLILADGDIRAEVLTEVQAVYDRIAEKSIGPNGDEFIALVNSGRNEVLSALRPLLAQIPKDADDCPHGHARPINCPLCTGVDS